MDPITFITSTTGGIVLLGLGIFLWMVMGKGSGKKKRNFNTFGKLLALVGAMILVIPIFGVGIGEPPPGKITPGVETDYSIVWVVDSTLEDDYLLKSYPLRKIPQL